jgi:hypothetical protein
MPVLESSLPHFTQRTVQYKFTYLTSDLNRLKSIFLKLRDIVFFYLIRKWQYLKSLVVRR